MEPILIKDASLHGVKFRFDTEFVRSEQTTGQVKTVLRDRLNGYEYTVRSKYLVGADGANSKVVSQLNLPLDTKPPGPVALNILFDMDLAKYMESRNGGIHWVFLQMSHDSADIYLGSEF
jgi:2,4-dichlorophenol 6-monooxygenase